MRVSHFAQIQVIVPPATYTPSGATRSTGSLKTVGMAQNISVDDNFGTRAENTIGTPLPVLAPGYQVTNIRIEKATIDGSDFRNLGAFNPLWAHVGSTYTSNINIQPAMGVIDAGSAGDAGNDSMFPFMFVLAVKNRVSNSYTRSNITVDNEPGAVGGAPNSRSNSFGIYACVLQNASISMSSGQAVIMDSVNAVARPISGTWFNETVRAAFANNGDATNGMRDIVNSVMYGYYS